MCDILVYGNYTDQLFKTCTPKYKYTNMQIVYILGILHFRSDSAIIWIQEGLQSC